MPTKPTTVVSSANSQKDQRYPETVFDQHRSARFPNGRPWWGYVEFASNPKMPNGFCTELMPGDHNDPFNSVWTAPWVPVQMSTGGNTQRSYLRLDMKRLRLTWNYQGIIADDTQAFQAFYDDAAERAYAKGWPAPTFGDVLSPQLSAIMGRPPRSPKIAEAALAGDPWILGQTEQVNEVLATLLKNQYRFTGPLAPLTLSDVALRPSDLDAKIAAAIQAYEAKKGADRAAKMRAGKKPKAPKMAGATA